MTDNAEEPSKPTLRPITQLPHLRDVTTGELTKPGQWVVANIAGSLFWPTALQQARYRGFDIFVLPPTQEGHWPGLAIKVAGSDHEPDARKAIMGFLSALCWTNNHAGAWVEGWTGGGAAYRMVGRRSTTLSAHPFELDYLPDPVDPKALLALALCREAAALNQATYAVISYFRVFETHFQRSSGEIKAWLNANVDSLADGQAKDVLNRLTATEPNIGQYLYGSCRSAAAHGKIGSQRVVDPDDPEDERRLARDLPLIRAMAIKLTEEILGIRTTSTVYREHLYELAGFKPLFSREALEAFAAGEFYPAEEKVELPTLNVGLTDKPAYEPLCGLQPVHLQLVPGGAKALFRREDGRVEFEVLLDFQSERLKFDIGRDLRLVDDGSPKPRNSRQASWRSRETTS